MVKEVLERISTHSVVQTKGIFFVLCYQCNPSILPTVTHIYIVAFKAKIDEHGPHEKMSSLKTSFFCFFHKGPVHCNATFST